MPSTAAKPSIVVGTSGSVWPAAGLASRARERGVETILVNLDALDDLDFDHVRLGPASLVLPDLVAEILDGETDVVADATAQFVDHPDADVGL